MSKNKHKIKMRRPLMLSIVVTMDKLFYNPPTSEFKSMEIENTTGPNTDEKQFGFKLIPLRDGLSYLAK